MNILKIIQEDIQDDIFTRIENNISFSCSKNILRLNRNRWTRIKSLFYPEIELLIAKKEISGLTIDQT